MYKLAIFDVDGTLLNTLDDLNDCMNIFLKKHSFPLISVDKTREYVGNGAKVYVQKATGICDERVLDEYTKEYSQILKECGNKSTKVYDGFDKVLKKLKSDGVTLAILSNKPQAAVEKCCEKYLQNYDFSCVLGEREGLKRKPAAESVQLILNTLGFSSKDAVMIGDTEVDYQTAINGGIDCINVLWGFRDKNQLVLSGANNFVSTAEELYDKIIG